MTKDGEEITSSDFIRAFLTEFVDRLFFDSSECYCALVNAGFQAGFYGELTEEEIRSEVDEFLELVEDTTDQLRLRRQLDKAKLNWSTLRDR
jgi:hypothetical protein